MSDSEISCGPLRVAWRADPPRIAVERAGARVTLVPEPVSGSAGWLLGRGRIKGRAGPAQRLELQLPHGGAPGVRIVLEVPEEGDGLVVELWPERGGTSSTLSLPDASPVPERPAVLEGLCFASGAMRGLVTRLDRGAPVRAQDPLVIPSAPGEGSPGRLWIGLGDEDGDVEGKAIARLAAERGAAPPRRGAVAGPGAAILGQRPIAVASPADDALPDGGWRVGTGTPRSNDVGRVEAWEPDDPLACVAGAGRLWQLAFRLDVTTELPALRTGASLAGLAGGLAFLDGPDASLGGEARHILRRCLPPLSRTPRLVRPGVLITPLIGARVALVLWNDGDGVQPASVRWEELGVAGPQHAFDFWGERDLGVHEGSLDLGPLEPGACRVVALTAPAARPQVVGSTLHIGMGTLDVAALRSEAAGRRVLLRLPGTHRGTVFVAEPEAGAVYGHRVAFEDAGEALLPLPDSGTPSALV